VVFEVFETLLCGLQSRWKESADVRSLAKDEQRILPCHRYVTPLRMHPSVRSVREENVYFPYLLGDVETKLGNGSCLKSLLMARVHR
jgi:hypothetical protein